MDSPRRTETLRRAARGESAAVEELLADLYEELRALAARRLSRERREHTLDPTALVHEAYLRLIDSDAVEVSDRRHFFALAARAIRRVLVDHARSRASERKGGDRARVTLRAAVDGETDDLELLDLDAALRELEARSPRQAEVVHLRFFAGLTVDEVAAMRGVSDVTIKNDWRAARAWLRRFMSREDG